jgi:hypothetical protein
MPVAAADLQRSWAGFARPTRLSQSKGRDPQDGLINDELVRAAQALFDLSSETLRQHFSEVSALQYHEALHSLAEQVASINSTCSTLQAVMQALGEISASVTQATREMSTVSPKTMLEAELARASSPDHYSLSALLDDLALQVRSVMRPEKQTLPAAIEPEAWRHFRFIGQAHGPYATPSGRLEELSFWRILGEPAIHWIVQRLDELSDLRFTWSVSGLLSHLAPASIGPMLDHLESAPSYEASLALLSALEGLNNTRFTREQQSHLAQLLRRYLAHPDDAVRSQAAGTTAALDREQAVAMLREALDKEADPDVRRSVLDELGERGEQ